MNHYPILFAIALGSYGPSPFT